MSSPLRSEGEQLPTPPKASIPGRRPNSPRRKFNALKETSGFESGLEMKYDGLAYIRTPPWMNRLPILTESNEILVHKVGVRASDNPPVAEGISSLLSVLQESSVESESFTIQTRVGLPRERQDELQNLPNIMENSPKPGRLWSSFGTAKLRYERAHSSLSSSMGATEEERSRNRMAALDKLRRRTVSI